MTAVAIIVACLWAAAFGWLLGMYRAQTRQHTDALDRRDTALDDLATVRGELAVTYTERDIARALRDGFDEQCTIAQAAAREAIEQRDAEQAAHRATRRLLTDAQYRLGAVHRAQVMRDAWTDADRAADDGPAIDLDGQERIRARRATEDGPGPRNLMDHLAAESAASWTARTGQPAAVRESLAAFMSARRPAGQSDDFAFGMAPGSRPPSDLPRFIGPNGVDLEALAGSVPTDSPAERLTEHTHHWADATEWGDQAIGATRRVCVGCGTVTLASVVNVERPTDGEDWIDDPKPDGTGPFRLIDDPTPALAPHEVDTQ